MKAISQRSRLAADWEPSDEDLAAIAADEEVASIAAIEKEPKDMPDGEVDPRWVQGGASHQKFSAFASDEEENDARQSAREQKPWDADAQWVRDLMQPAEIGSIPHAKGTRKKRKHVPRVVPLKHSDRNDDNPAVECVKLFRFRAWLSPGEFYFFEIRPGYALIVVRRYLEDVRQNGFERRDMRKRFNSVGITRTRQVSTYVEEHELRELAVCPGGAARALAERARAEDPVRVASVDQLARRKPTATLSQRATSVTLSTQGYL